MKITEVQEILHAQLVTDLVEDFDVEFGYGCDLMSDVLAFVQHNDILLTGLVNPQVIRTCEVVDIHAIVFVRGKVPGTGVDRNRDKCRDYAPLHRVFAVYILWIAISARAFGGGDRP